MDPTPFRSSARFRAWLQKNHGRRSELLVSCAKAGAGTGLSYKQALDEALCFGWIDGVRRSIDETCFSVRFTPRKPKSYWSAVNIRRARELEAEGRMHAAGLAVFRGRVEREARYSFESRPRALAPELERRFRAQKRAWADFQARPPWYRRTSSFWVMSAKQPETRARRFELLLECSKKGVTIPMLTRAPKRTMAGR
jgi:uncharacterized protein YdeI (YjbR/CyaY-like superfamily)